MRSYLRMLEAGWAKAPQQGETKMTVHKLKTRPERAKEEDDRQRQKLEAIAATLDAVACDQLPGVLTLYSAIVPILGTIVRATRRRPDLAEDAALARALEDVAAELGTIDDYVHHREHERDAHAQ